MCGIIGGFNTVTPEEKKKKVPAPPINDFVIETYEDQHTRGKEGFGIIRIDAKKNVTVDRATEPVKFMLDLKMNLSPMIIAHHRTPTSTDNKLSQTHPIFVNHESLGYDYFVVHNGVISNADDLADKHSKIGFTYTTKVPDAKKFGYQYYRSNEFNDSEAFAIELALFIEGRSTHLGHKGSAAYIALQTNKKTGKAERVFFGRDGNPLKVYKTNGQLVMSSEGIGEAIPIDILHHFEIGDDNLMIKTQECKVVPYELPKPASIITTPPNYSHSSYQEDRDWNAWRGMDDDKTEIKTKVIGEKVSAHEERLSDAKSYMDEEVERFKQDIRDEDIEYITSNFEEETENQSKIINDELETFFHSIEDPLFFKDANVNETMDIIKMALILSKRYAVAAHAESAIAETKFNGTKEEQAVSNGTIYKKEKTVVPTSTCSLSELRQIP